MIERLSERNAKIMALIDKKLAEIDTPEKAMAELIACGIYTEAGELHPEYGGPALPPAPTGE